MCRTHGASTPCARSDGERLREPVAARGEDVADELDRAAATEPPVRAQRRAACPRATRARCRARRRRGRRSAGTTRPRRATPRPARRRSPRSSGAGTWPRPRASASPSGGRCSGTRARAAPSSSASSACAAPPTQSGCQALKTSCRYPGSVSSAVRMQPAELVLALEHADAPAAAREQGRAGERVDPAADDDRVSHARARGTRRRSRARACVSRAPSRARARPRSAPRGGRARAPRP